MYMLHRLRQEGFVVRSLEKGEGVGGTWYWNRYPGARCDVESMEYSYSWSDELQQDWVWTERYAGQPEILQYANHDADRFDLRKDIEFETQVKSAHYQEEHQHWLISTNRNEQLTANFIVMATGCLSSTNRPEFDGLDRYQGRVLHTGEWPHYPVDLSGTHVGIIGTGSSAIQAIPHIAEECGHLTVFQRTPNFSIPARNKPLDASEMNSIKANYAVFRERNKQMPAALGARFFGSDRSALETPEIERESEFESRWEYGGFSFLGAFNDLSLNRAANEIAAAFVREKIAETVADEETATKLSPHNVIGCKRLCLDTNYYETYNRENVRLVDINDEPIESFSENGIKTSKATYDLDTVIFATGFDAMTGTLLRIDIRGENDRTLREKWEAGPTTYLGLMTEGFPNMFMISGPGSPSVLTNMIVSIEQHVDWVTDCLSYLREHQCRSIHPSEKAETEWVAYVNGIADLTLYPTCNSWYLGANIPGKPRVFMPHVGFPNYVAKCDEVVANDYQGFLLQ